MINTSNIKRKRHTTPNLDYGVMKEICRFRSKQIAKRYKLDFFPTPEGEGYYFQDNGADVLAIAQMKPRSEYRHFVPARLGHDTRVFCPTLDNRLGVYILLSWLAAAGIKADILITTGSEKNRTTGFFFEPPRSYNWMFSFGKYGDGVAMYDYEDKDASHMLSNFGFRMDDDNYNDIVHMRHLGCKGINFGNGINFMHAQGKDAEFSRKILMSQLEKFQRFYWKFNSTFFAHDPKLDIAIPIKRETKGTFTYDDFSKVIAEHTDKITPSEDEWEEDNYFSPQPPYDVEDAVIVSETKVKSKKVKGPRRSQVIPRLKIAHRLYHEIDTMSLDVTSILILKNTMGIHYVHDLVKLSKINLLATGKFSKGEVDLIAQEAKWYAWAMPANLQGFLTPDEFFKLKAKRNSYRYGNKLPVDKPVAKSVKVQEVEPSPSLENGDIIIEPVYAKREEVIRKALEMKKHLSSPSNRGIWIRENCVICGKEMVFKLKKTLLNLEPICAIKDSKCLAVSAKLNRAESEAINSNQDKTKIKNPKTGKMVLKTGKIGKAILINQKSKSKTGGLTLGTKLIIRKQKNDEREYVLDDTGAGKFREPTLKEEYTRGDKIKLYVAPTKPITL